MAGAHLWLLKKWFCVLVMLSACCAVSVPRNDDAMVTCDTTSSALGETGQVTCHFPADVSSLLPAAITIEKYSNTDQKAVILAETVLDCKWYEGGDIQCATKEGYEVHGPVERQLYLNITVMAQAHAGRYKCKIMTPRLVTNDEHVCDLKILPAKKPVPTEEATTIVAAVGVGEESDAQSVPETDVSAANSSITVIIGAVVGGVVFIAVIVLLIVFLVRRRRRSNAASGSGSAKTTDAEDPNSPGLPERDYEPNDQARTPLLRKTDDVNNENDAELAGPPKPPRTMETTNSTTEQNDEINRNNDVDALNGNSAPADVKAQNDDALNSKTGLANAPKAAPADAKTPNDDKALTGKIAPADVKPQNDGNASGSGKAALAEAKDQNGDDLNGKDPKPALADAKAQHDKDAPNGKTAIAEAPKTGLDDAKAQAALADAKPQNDEDAGDADDDVFSASLRRKGGSQRKGSKGNWREELLEAATDIDGRARERIMADDYPFMSDDIRAAAKERERKSSWGTASRERKLSCPPDPDNKGPFDASKLAGTYNYLSSPPAQ